MQIDIIKALLFLTTALISFFVWKKYNKDKDYLWLGIIAMVGVLLNIWDYLVANVLQLGSEIKLINDTALLVIWIFFLIWIFKILFFKRK